MIAIITLSNRFMLIKESLLSHFKLSFLINFSFLLINSSCEVVRVVGTAVACHLVTFEGSSA